LDETLVRTLELDLDDDDCLYLQGIFDDLIIAVIFKIAENAQKHYYNKGELN
jgi:hypothetical protein